jgi:hypothetical protein
LLLSKNILIFARKKINIMATIQVPNTQMTPLDALWTLFKSQPKSVRRAFTQRLLADEATEDLKANVVKHIKAVREGKEKTYSFDTLAEAKKWLNE